MGTRSKYKMVHSFKQKRYFIVVFITAYNKICTKVTHIITKSTYNLYKRL